MVLSNREKLRIERIRRMGPYPLVRTWTSGFAADNDHATLDEAIYIDTDLFRYSEACRHVFWDRAPVSLIMSPLRGFGPRRIPLTFVDLLAWI